MTHKDLHSQQALASISGVNGKLYWQAGWDPGCIQTRSTSPDLAGIVRW